MLQSTSERECIGVPNKNFVFFLFSVSLIIFRCYLFIYSLYAYICCKIIFYRFVNVLKIEFANLCAFVTCLYRFCLFVPMAVKAENVNFFIQTMVLNEMSGSEIHRLLSNAWGEKNVISERRVQQLASEFSNETRTTCKRKEGSGKRRRSRTVKMLPRYVY